MYLLKLALRPWRISPFSQIFAAAAVGLLLFLAGFMLWLDQGLKPVLARMQTDQVITAYLDPALDEKDEGKVVDAIRVSLGAHAEIRAVGARQFVEDLRPQYPVLSHELEDLGGEMNTVIPRFVSISGVFSSDTVDRVKSVQGVESAESSKDRFKNVLGAFRALRRVARILAIGLFAALLAGLFQLSRLNSHFQRDALSMLRMWGAGAFTIRMPGMLSGLLTGISGAAAAIAAWVTAGAWLARHVKALSPMLREMPLPAIQVCALLLGAGLLVGLVSGILGSSAAIRATGHRG